MDEPVNTNSEQDEIQFLFDLYYDIGERLCEKLGHDWETITPSDGTDVPMNSITFERCSRCNETKRSPDQFATSGSHTTVDEAVLSSKLTAREDDPEEPNE